MAMLGDLPGRPNGQLLRRALRHWAFVTLRPGQGEMPAQDRLVLQWVAKISVPWWICMIRFWRVMCWS